MMHRKDMKSGYVKYEKRMKEKAIATQVEGV